MKSKMLVMIAGLVVAFLIGLNGCATKKYVATEIATIDQKIASVSTEIEEAQKRIKEHDEKLATIGELITQHDSQFKKVDEKFNEVITLIRGSLILKETLRSDEVKFAFNSFELSPEAKAAIDRIIQKLIQENRGVYIEIQGYTDNVGPEEVNLALGRKRAEAVMMYLYKTYHIPLHRMAVVSFGSSAPIADNKTRQGRAKNRRVEILVYE